MATDQRSVVVINDDDSEKRNKIPFLDLESTPSPPKKPRTDGQLRSSIHCALPDSTEDGEIVSSPGSEAEEISINADMTSPERTPEIIKEQEVIQILDTPEDNEADKPVKTVAKKPEGKDVGSSNKDLKKPKTQSPRKESKLKRDSSSDRHKNHRDEQRKRTYDVQDERHVEQRHVEKRLTDQTDLRKHLLKRLGSDKQFTRAPEVERHKEEIKEHKTQSENLGKNVHDAADNAKAPSKGDSVERKKERRVKRHDERSRKKKKHRYREEQSPNVIDVSMKLEKSPDLNEALGISENVTSDSSMRSLSPLLLKSPMHSPNLEHSPVSSLTPERSPVSSSRSPSPVRSPTPQRKRSFLPAVEGCRSVEEFTWLNRIEEGTYGVVYRARDKRTDEIVALKRLKMEREREGFPITSLREINCLLKAQHPNIVTVREIVVGSNTDKIYIVMDYVEHDLKSLMETMNQPFLVGEVKTLMIQLLRGVHHMHDNWILHRDIKASNLLLSHKGILKIGDFGLAREYGSPLKRYTSVVVTLWYRAPELLLGAKEYSTAIDAWSVGCVFAELLSMKPLFPGKSEIDQINRIFKELGAPNDKIWPGPPAYSELPMVKKINIAPHPYNVLRQRFGATLTDVGFNLLNRLLTYDPSRRISMDEALKHPYFEESPKPVDSSMFPTWPAKSELGRKFEKKNASPKPPEGGQFNEKLNEESGFQMSSATKGSAAKGMGFNLKF